MSDYFWAEKFVEFIHDVDVECFACEATKTIKDAELAGNIKEVFLSWKCDCGQKHYKNFDTTQFNDEVD